MSAATASWVSHLPPSSSHYSSGRGAVLGNRLSFCQPLPLPHPERLLVSGLPAPVLDEMSTAYQPSMAAYSSHGLPGYSQPLVATRPRAVVNEPRAAQNYRHAQQPHQQSQSQQSMLHQQAQPAVAAQSRAIPTSSQNLAFPGSGHDTKLSTPASECPPSSSQSRTVSRRSSDTLVFHSLQIPKCISANGGNLAEFAAQMTCLFWFQTVDDLKQAESIRSRPSNAPIPRLPTLAKPYEQFRKWVYSVLSTTQVTQNVILLALLFIYRLKMSTPQIKGRAGSEYRLLTVALMLGNKFLDDNTYTNKTWAEVSCFAVQEIHVMEVEFLSNMRYNLLASEAEWEGWLVKLAVFHEYYERASRLPSSPIRVTSPTNKNFNTPIPSPTTTMPSSSDLFPITPSAATGFSPSSSQSQNWQAYQVNAISPLAAKPPMEFPITRKRSVEDEVPEHPAKRVAPPRLAQVSGPPMTARPNGPAESARLPVPPQLTLITNQQPTSQPVSYAPPNGYPAPLNVTSQGMVSLPPLQSGVRAMSTVYQQPVAAMVQQVTAPASIGPPLPTTSYPAASISTHPQLGFSTPSKHSSPAPLATFGSSPMVDHYGPGSGVHTPISHTPMTNSPSVYLQQRNSPYKPIRHVNTLLYPPPSASLDQYHLAVPVPPTQMHYQPLGRRNDLRTGVVPEFVMYNRAQHMPTQPQGQPQGHYIP